MNKHLSQEFLSKIIDYNESTGVFTWKKRNPSDFLHKKNPCRSCACFNASFAGKKAGSILRTPRSKTYYIAIKIDGKSYKAHRLAFILKTGSCPEEVDHIDHTGTNNSWSNLRASNKFDNAKNHPIQKSNKTGVAGVNWHKSAKKWQVRANDNGSRVDLGRYDSFEKAVSVRRDYEKKFGYYEHRGEI